MVEVSKDGLTQRAADIDLFVEFEGWVQEYRRTMDADVLHLWALDMVDTGKRLLKVRDRFLDTPATLQAERDRYRVALEAVAAFAPKSAAGSKIEQVLQNEWNRAGEYAATIARTALSDTPTVQS